MAWKSYFNSLSTKLEAPSSTHVSVLQELNNTLGGPAQYALPHLEGPVALYDFDIVAPIIARGTDIDSAAHRNALLSTRATDANRERLLVTRSKFVLNT